MWSYLKSFFVTTPLAKSSASLSPATAIPPAPPLPSAVTTVVTAIATATHPVATTMSTSPSIATTSSQAPCITRCIYKLPEQLRILTQEDLGDAARILIVARPGSGKTALLRHVLEQQPNSPVCKIIADGATLHRYKDLPCKPSFSRQFNVGILRALLKEQARAIRRYQAQTERALVAEALYDEAQEGFDEIDAMERGEGRRKPRRPHLRKASRFMQPIDFTVCNPKSLLVLEDTMLLGPEHQNIVERLVEAMIDPVHRPHLGVCLTQPSYCTVPTALVRFFDWLLIPLPSSSMTETADYEAVRQEWLPEITPESWAALCERYSSPGWLAIRRDPAKCPRVFLYRF